MWRRGVPRRISKGAHLKTGQGLRFVSVRQDQSRQFANPTRLLAVKQRESTPVVHKQAYTKRCFITFCGVAGQTAQSCLGERRTIAAGGKEHQATWQKGPPRDAGSQTELRGLAEPPLPGVLRSQFLILWRFARDSVTQWTAVIRDRGHGNCAAARKRT